MRHQERQRRFDHLITMSAYVGDPKWVRVDMERRLEKIAKGQDPSVPDVKVPTVSEYIECELEWLLKKYKKKATVKSQIKCWLLEYFKGNQDKPLDQVTRKDVIRFLEWVASQRSKVTANRCFALLSVLMKHAVDDERIDRNPCAGVEKFREPESRTRIFSDDEFERYCIALMKFIEHQHAKILYLLVLLSLRFTEVASMEWQYVNFDTGEYTIPMTKNGRRRVIALNGPALELLKEMYEIRKQDRWVFPARVGDGHTVNVRPMHKRILNDAGIESSFRIHDIRRSGASSLLNDYDANPLKVKEILGHLSMSSTMAYTHLSAKSMAATSDLLAQKFTKAVSK